MLSFYLPEYEDYSLGNTIWITRSRTRNRGTRIKVKRYEQYRSRLKDSRGLLRTSWERKNESPGTHWWGGGITGERSLFAYARVIANYGGNSPEKKGLGDKT